MAASTTNHWKLGLFIVGGVFMAFCALLSLGSRQFRRESYRSVSYFDESVQGLEVGSPVKFRGVQVGSVASISVAQDARHVEVQSDIDLNTLRRVGLPVMHNGNGMKDEPAVPTGLRVQLVSAGITGVKFIGADFFTTPVRALPFTPPHNFVPSEPSTLKSVEEALTEAMNQIPKITGEVNALLTQINDVITKIDAPGIARSTRSTLDSIDRSLHAIEASSIVTRTAAALDEARATLESARRLGDQLGAEKGPLFAAVARIDAAGAALERAIRDADAGATTATLRRTAGEFGQTARNLNDLDEEVRADLVAFREAMDSLRSLSAMLERDPSSLLHGKSPETTTAAGNKP